MNDKLKFYRSTLVQMTKEAYRKKPKELKIEEAVVEAELLTKAIMKQVDEFENSFNYQTQVSVEEEVLNKFIETANVAFKNSTDLSSNSVKQMEKEGILSTLKELGFRTNEVIELLEQNKIVFAYEHLKKIFDHIDKTIKSIEN